MNRNATSLNHKCSANSTAQNLAPNCAALLDTASLYEVSVATRSKSSNLIAYPPSFFCNSSQ